MSKNEHDINKKYVSPYDIFLKKFDKTHPPSASQLQEIRKHERIAQLRDVKAEGKGEDVIWESF